MIQQAIRIAIEGENLPFETAKKAMDEIMRGQATNAQIAAFLTALRMKGESIDEITACAAAMREHCTKLPHDAEVLEIVGTGGDEAYTFNISTISAFVIAGAGVPVAKHGNRSVSSKCGAADLLEALGVNLMLGAERSARILNEEGICFLFAPVYHAAMKYAAPVRKEMGARTVFNILGPLSNPANASMQLLGVYDKALLEPLAQTLANLGVKRAMVACGEDGLDEITLSARTNVCELKEGTLSSYAIDPRDYGLSLCEKSDLVGGDAKENADIARSVLRGETGARRDVVLLNAGACLYLADRAENIAGGVALAARSLDSGAAYERMRAFVRATNEETK
ncbi:MAG: anthranilate phosphoribosyltransferase [Oscillospiraceae bacterium]|nr:anthranilate phosphoribosyltransferase [Oscillospiraceae bacterium]